MFEIKIEGVEALSAKLEKYPKQITELQSVVPQEMEAWQRDDMHRKYPNTESATISNETTATTYVWPRSRTPSKRERRFQAPKKFQPSRRGPVSRSNRPILRAELLTQLWQRMVRLTAEAMKWP